MAFFQCLNCSKVRLPVRLRNGYATVLPWGRRINEASNLPLGGWARLDAITAGKWDKYFPKPVQLPIGSFMAKDIEGKIHWFPVVKGQWVQGLLAQYDRERRIYVVTVTPEKEDALFERWPRLVFG